MPDTQLKIATTDQGVLLQVKVVPGASRNKVLGVLGEALKVAVAVAPEKGHANKALVKLLSEKLGIAKNRISLHQGKSSPHKVLLIEGLGAAELKEKLGFPARKP